MTAPAARTNDVTSHATPLSPGPGSANVLIGNLPAWRALPSSVGGGLEAASNAMSTFMTSPSLTPVDATATLAQVQASMMQAAAAAALEGNPAASATATSAFTALNATNVALTATYITASAVPGGAAAAAVAYTEVIQAAAAGAMTAAVAAIAGAADMHNCPLPCPTPPHGPGLVTHGSTSVFFNNLPASRQGDNVFEACGGADAIAMGCLTVFIGDAGGSGGVGGAATASATGAPAAAPPQSPAEIAAAATVTQQNTAAAASGAALCEICDSTGVSSE